MDKDTALKTAFVVAARDGHTEIMELLCEAGVDIHAWKDVALRTAADAGQTEAVWFLLEHGADLHAKEDEAVRAAESNGHRETATLLRQWSARSASGPNTPKL